MSDFESSPTTVEAARSLYGGVAAHLAGDRDGAGMMARQLADVGATYACVVGAAAAADILRRISAVAGSDPSRLADKIVDSFLAGNLDGRISDASCTCARVMCALLSKDHECAALIAAELEHANSGEVAAAAIALVGSTLRTLSLHTSTDGTDLARQLCKRAAATT